MWLKNERGEDVTALLRKFQTVLTGVHRWKFTELSFGLLLLLQRREVNNRGFLPPVCRSLSAVSMWLPGSRWLWMGRFICSPGCRRRRVCAVEPQSGGCTRWTAAMWTAERKAFLGSGMIQPGGFPTGLKSFSRFIYCKDCFQSEQKYTETL